MVWLTALANIFGFFSKLITFLHERKLKEAGAAEEKLKQVEAENEAIETAKAIKQNSATITRADKLAWLRALRRKES